VTGAALQIESFLAGVYVVAYLIYGVRAVPRAEPAIAVLSRAFDISVYGDPLAVPIIATAYPVFEYIPR